MLGGFWHNALSNVKFVEGRGKSSLNKNVNYSDW